MNDELDEQTAEDARKFMRRMAVFTMFCLAVSGVILLIDRGIKREVLAKAAEANRTLEEFRALAEEVRGGSQAAGPEPGSSGDGDGAGDHGGDGVVDVAGQRADVAAAPAAPRGKVGGRAARPAGGTPGNG